MEDNVSTDPKYMNDDVILKKHNNSVNDSNRSSTERVVFGSEGLSCKPANPCKRDTSYRDIECPNIVTTWKACQCER